MRISGRTLAMVVAGAVTVVSLYVVVTARHARPADRPRAREVAAVVDAPRVVPRGSVAALAVLHGWDHARARAWVRGDVPALRRLYAAGSLAGRHDAAMLRRWTDRGLRVRGMRMQLLRVRIEDHTARRIVLVVTDRLVGAYAVGRGRRYRLPRDDATTRRLELRRVEGRWLMVAVSS